MKKQTINKTAHKQVSKARATPKQSYAQIMQELGIVVYDSEKSQKCNYNLVQDRKEGLILKNIRKIQQPVGVLTFLRYRAGFYNLQFQKPKSEKMPNIAKNGGFRA